MSLRSTWATQQIPSQPLPYPPPKVMWDEGGAGGTGRRGASVC